MVLDDLVFNDAHVRFFDRQLRQRNARIGGSQSGATEDMVNLLLREAGEFLLSGLDTSHQGVQIFLRDYRVFLLVVCC